MASPDKPTDLPRYTNEIFYFFFWLQKYSWLHLVFSWHQLVKLPLIFVPSHRIESRWTSDRKRQFSRWFRFKRKVWQNRRFWALKTSEKWLFYRLNANSFIFKQFDMLRRHARLPPQSPCRKVAIFPSGHKSTYYPQYDYCCNWNPQ